MSETHTLFKIVLAVGIILLLIGALNPAAGAAWDDFATQVNTFPSFVNPFDAAPSSEDFLAVPTQKSHEYHAPGVYAPASYVGCANNTINRTDCLNSADDEESYIEITLPSGDGVTTIFFQWSDPRMAIIDGTTIRRVTVITRCMTVEGPELAFSISWYGVASLGAGEPLWGTSCPKRAYGGVVAFRDYPTGSPTNPTKQYVGETGEWYDAGLHVPSGVSYNATVTVRFTFIEIRVHVTYEIGACQAPTGAWFPWADEVACAIGRLAEYIWKGILFVINGLIFVGQMVFWFITLVIGFIGLFTYVFAIPDAPPIVQAIVTMLFVSFLALLGFIFFRMVTDSASPV